MCSLPFIKLFFLFQTLIWFTGLGFFLCRRGQGKAHVTLSEFNQLLRFHQVTGNCSNNQYLGISHWKTALMKMVTVMNTWLGSVS